MHPTAGTSVASQAKLKAEIIRLKRELQSTSSQDEFAKWAKLRRQHDKAMAEYEQQCKDQGSEFGLHRADHSSFVGAAGSIQSFRSTFDKAMTAARWLGTNGLRALLQFWYQKEPLFWMPKRWVPVYIEWILSFPRAPIGSVSIQMWAISCGTVIRLIGAALVAAWVLIQTSKGKERHKVKVSAGSATGIETKKEL